MNRWMAHHALCGGAGAGSSRSTSMAIATMSQRAIVAVSMFGYERMNVPISRQTPVLATSA